MNARPTVFGTRHRSGSPRRAVCFLALAIVTAAAHAAERPAMSETNGREALAGKSPAAPGAASDEPSSPPGAWGEAARNLILEEAVDRLPEPLRDLLGAPTQRARLREALAAPPAEATEAPTPGHEQDERPEDTGRQAAGATPRAAAEALDALTTALAGEGPDAAFTASARLARSAVGLHMPFHTTANADGAETGNHGVARAVGVGLIARYEDVYAEAIRQNRRPVRYLSEPADRLAAWAAEARQRVAPILEADTVARREATYNPAQHPEDLADLDAEAARPYYEALKRELARRDSPEAAALRDAAANLADLVYTAWVQAGKPLALQPGGEAAGEGDPSSPYWLLALAVGMLVILLWPRRRPGAEEEPRT